MADYKYNHRTDGNAIEIQLRPTAGGVAVETVTLTATGNPGEYGGTLTSVGKFHVVILDTGVGSSLATGYIDILSSGKYREFGNYGDLELAPRGGPTILSQPETHNA